MQKFIMQILLISALSGLMLLSCGRGNPGENKANSSHNDSTAQRADTTGDPAEETGQDRNTVNDEDLIPVEVTTVGLGDISDFILLSSNLETEVMADVYSRVQGIVETVHKEEGQYVAKGDTLLSLEAEENKLAERRARVEYDKQLKNYERMKEMYNKELLSDDEFENARFALEAAKIAWEETKLTLDYMQIQSPIDGWIGERLAKVGARIQLTNKLFTVVNKSQVIAVVWVPEKNINQIRVGQPVKLTSDHITGASFDGWVKRISPVVDPSSGTFKVTVGVRNVGSALRPGMFVNVHIIIDTHEDVVLIPKTAVVYEKEYMNVFVVRDSVAHKIRLDVGFEDNEKIESMTGIEPGEKIIVVGQAGMKDQTRVHIVTERKNPFLREETAESSGV